MKVLLKSQDSMKVVQESLEEPEKTTRILEDPKKMLKQTRSKDKATLYTLYRVVDESIFKRLLVHQLQRKPGKFWKRYSRVSSELNKCVFKLYEVSWRP